VKAKALAKSNSKRVPNSPSTTSRGQTPSTVSRKSRYGSNTKTTPGSSSSIKKSTPTPTPKSKANVSVTFEDDENINNNNNDNNNNSTSQNESIEYTRKIKKPTANSTPSEKFMYRLQLANQLQERYGKR
jgi:hypothetical protein